MRYKHQVFICHRGSVKSEIAFPLMALFTYVCGPDFAFFDQASLIPGEWAEPCLSQAVNDSRWCIVILSEDFFESDYTLQEIEAFLNRQPETGATHTPSIIPVFLGINPDKCAKLPEEMRPSTDRFTSEEKRKLAVRLAEITGHYTHGPPRTLCDFLVDLVLEFIQSKYNRTLEDNLKTTLTMLYYEAVDFHRRHLTLTPFLFNTFLSSMRAKAAGMRAQTMTINSILAEQSLQRTQERAQRYQAYQCLPPVAVDARSHSIEVDLRKIENCIQSENHLDLVQKWRSATDALAVEAISIPPVEILRLGDTLEALGIALLRTVATRQDQNLGNTVASFYDPWLKHKSVAVDHAWWVAELARTAERYYQEAYYSPAKLLYQKALAVCTHSDERCKILHRLVHVSLITQDIADAMLYAVYGPLQNILPIVEDSALLYLVDISLSNRPFTLLLKNVDKNSFMTCVGAWAQATHRLWAAATHLTDFPLKKKWFDQINNAYQQILNVINVLGLPEDDALAGIRTRYRPMIEDRDPAPDELITLHQSPVVRSWEKIQKSLSTSRSQTYIVDAFCELLAHVANIVGPAPCRYAVMGMGSLARGEACPFSDLEFAIVLEEPLSPLDSLMRADIPQYFSTLMQWLELQLIAMGESVQAVVWETSTGKIPVTLGFRLDDGGNVPFSRKGQTTFIGTPTQLLQNFVIQDKGLIPGDTITANTLQGAAHLWGDPQCTAAFRAALWTHFQSTGQNQAFALHLLEDHLTHPVFNVCIDTEIRLCLNIKNGFLRLPVFIVESLSLYHGIQEVQNTVRLEKLVEQKRMSQTMADALHHCIALGLTIRTKAHLHYGQEEDKMYFNAEDATTAEIKNPYILSEMDQALLRMVYRLMFLPTITLVRSGLEKLLDTKPYDTALLLHQDQEVQHLSDTVLRVAAQDNLSEALCGVRFLAQTAYKTNLYYQAYYGRFTEMYESLNDTHTTAHEKTVLHEQLMRLPRPDGMRPSMMYRQQRWRATLESITDPLIPGQTLPPDGILLEGLEFRKRILKPEVVQRLFQKKSQSDFGTHTVTEIYCGKVSLHIKFCPEYPGTEKAASDLIHRVVGDYVQESELCQLTWPDGKRCPILIMRTVPGKNIAQCYKAAKLHLQGLQGLEAKLAAIDAETYSRLFIAALLTTNEDAKPDNIMFHLRYLLKDWQGRYPLSDAQQRLMHALTLIDNERCFLPSMAKIDGKTDLQMKHFVFCMTQMDNPLDESVKTEIESLDPSLLLSGWLETLGQYNARCKAVFGEQAIEQYARLKENPTLLLVVLLSHIHEDLFWKLQNLKSLWRKHPTITHRQLLQRLEPSASAVYDQTLSHAHSIARWEQIEKKYYVVKDGVAISTLKSNTIMKKTFAIPDKQSLVVLINDPKQSHRCYAPDIARNRLLHESDVHRIQTECVEGKLETFNSLPPSGKRQVLYTFDFKRLAGKIEMQQSLLKTLPYLYLKALRIRSAETLTDDLLIEIVKKNQAYLTSVELIDCTLLTINGIENLLSYGRGLEKLQLVKLSHLTAIRGGRVFTTAVLPQLQFLKIKECTTLQSLDLELEKIQRCIIQGNIGLNKIVINRLFCQALLKAASQKQYAAVKQALEKNPALIYAQGDITDARGRRFQQVSVLEYAEKIGDNELYELAVAYFPEKVKLEATHPTLGAVRFARPPLPQNLSDPDTALRCLIGESFTHRKALIEELKKALNKNRGSDKTKALERCMIRELKARYYAYHKQVWKPEAFFPSELKQLFDELPVEKAVSLDFVAYIDEYLDYLADQKKGHPPVVLMLGGFLDAIAELQGKQVYYWRSQNVQLCCIHEYAPKNTSDTAPSTDVLHILHQTTIFQRLTFHSQAGFIWTPQFMGPLVRYEAFTLAWQLERVNRKKVRPVSTAGQDSRLFLPTPTAYDAVKAKATSIVHQVTPQDIKKILDAVGNGELDTVKSCLDSNQNLLYVVGDVTDVADRLFSDVTVFQYALWAGDIPMCKMILERLPLSDVVLQRLAFENARVDIHAQHGRFFSFEPTLNQYDKYIRNYDRWSGDQCSLHWQKGVGNGQLTWPSWVRYKFTEPGESVSWVQQNSNIPYARSMSQDDYSKWTTKILDGKSWNRGTGAAAYTHITGILTWSGNLHDHQCLNNEQSAILEYRETLSRTQAHTTTEHTPIIGQAPRQ